MHAFSVAPFDQNLSIDGKGLTDDSATLGSLGVIPESIICLKVTTAQLAPVRRCRRIAFNFLFFPHRRMSQCQTTPLWMTCIRVSVITVASTSVF